MSDELLNWLEEWYLSQCEGDWEHGHGILIQTLDNPGWEIHIRIEDTSLQEKAFALIKIERSERDWVQCKVEELHFKGYGGPQNLVELIQIFRTWAESP